jgi:hypothetical protein
MLEVARPTSAWPYVLGYRRTERYQFARLKAMGVLEPAWSDVTMLYP